MWVVANGYLVEDFKVDKGDYRTVITISLAPQSILKKENNNAIEVKSRCTSDDPANHQGDTCPIHEENNNA